MIRQARDSLDRAVVATHHLLLINYFPTNMMIKSDHLIYIGLVGTIP